ncbi:hypothetical protein BMETH_160_3 [methanotrophic bacterial endosymbiont of Bathymodiolus sp.]|nr:hypothetical protein BMETH_160_3 [methanotrophic bacterial endosymbiont of Bathymodiolus sp.]
MNCWGIKLTLNHYAVKSWVVRFRQGQPVTYVTSATLVE